MRHIQLFRARRKIPRGHHGVRRVVTCETVSSDRGRLAVVAAWMVLVLNTFVHADGPVWIRRSGFDELRQGTAIDGGQNLYVSRQGRVQTINRMDLNLDGEIDLLFTQDHESVAAPDAMIYWGGPDGFQSLLPEMWELRAPFSVLTWIEQASSRITRLPTTGGGRTRVADLNNDGRLDIVIANFTHNYRTDQMALIYWGNDAGFSVTNRTELPTFLASGVAVGDLNGDQLPEIVLSNRGDERGNTWGYRLHLESYIYWGSADGYHPTRRTSIPTISAADVAMGDLNGDGAQDLAFVNFNREEQSAFIYFNDGDGGFPVERRQVLQRDDLLLRTAARDDSDRSLGMQTLLATRLDDDRFDDLIIAGTVNAVVYYGTINGLNIEPAFDLPADNCQGIAAHDLNGDGRPEILLANRGHFSADRHQHIVSPSTIFWAAEKGYDSKRRTELPALSATTVQVGDLNGDRIADIFFGNSRDEKRHDVPSHIYWGGPRGYAPYRRQALAGFGTIGSGLADLNRDGWPDILMVNHESGKHETMPAVVFWGNLDHHYSSALATLLDVKPRMEHSVADLDDDGFVDLVFLSERSARSLVVWGSAEGFNTITNKKDLTKLPVISPMSSSVADLNRDGFLDILFTVQKQLDAQRRVLAVILWGNGQRYEGARTTEWELSSLSTLANAIADLNRDGYLDLIFPLGASEHAEIWYGSENGFSRGDSQGLPVDGPPHAVPADLDRDGWLDLIFTSGTDMKRFTVNTRTFIYWGGPKGFSPSNRTQLEGYTGLDGTVADLNRDGHLDIAVTNYRSDTNRKVPTFIYWGDGSRNYNEKRRSLLPSASGSAINALDLNRDGWLELVVSNHQKNFDHGAGGTDIFWGSPEGYSSLGSRRTNLPTVGVHLDAMVDAGNVYDRKNQWIYEFDPVQAPPDASFKRLAWTATTMMETAVKFQVRSSSKKNGLEETIWQGPQGAQSFYEKSPGALAAVPAEHRYLQYRAVFTSPDGANTAYLSDVAVECSR